MVLKEDDTKELSKGERTGAVGDNSDEIVLPIDRTSCDDSECHVVTAKNFLASVVLCVVHDCAEVRW